MPFLMVPTWSSNIIKSLSIGLLVLLSAFQGKDYQLVKTYTVKADMMTADKFGAAYILNNTNELIKVAPDNDRILKYSLLRYGRPTNVDASNPLKVLLFYKDFSTIVLLDNNLAEKSVLKLQEKSFFQVSSACTSLDNKVWIYDALNYKLTKLDERLNIVLQSEDFGLLFNENLIPTFMREANEHLYVSVPSHGILVFDLFGAYIKTLPLKHVESFQVIKDQLVYFEDGKLMGFNTRSLQTGQIALPQLSNILKVQILEDKLLVLLNDRLNLYAY